MTKAPMNVQHAAASRVIKGEDTMKALHVSVEHQGHLFLVCDGHAGVHAANFVIDHFQRLLASRLQPDVFKAIEAEDYQKAAPDIQRALSEAFVLTDNKWLEARCHMAGTTVTVAVLLGRLLTMANVGDSEAVLDTGCSVLPLTHSHRIHTNLQEQARLKKAGCQIAPYGFHLQGPAEPNEQGVGPLRVWPSGLCVSRSIGDSDAGPEVVPMPHIKQVLIPEAGCRFMIASDGLWDVFKEFSKAVRLVRGHATQEAAAELIRIATLNHRVIDDTSVIVVDVLPSSTPSFPAVVKTLPQVPQSSGGFCSCMKAEVSEPDSRDVTGPGRLDYLAEVDALVQYPKLKDTLVRNSPRIQARGRSSSKRAGAVKVELQVEGARQDAGELTELQKALNGKEAGTGTGAQGNFTVHSGQGISAERKDAAQGEIESGFSE